MARRFGQDIDLIEKKKRFVFRPGENGESCLVDVDRTVDNQGLVQRFSINLVANQVDVRGIVVGFGTRDGRIYGYDTKWHGGKTGDCHRHCIYRDGVEAIHGTDCLFKGILSRFLGEMYAVLPEMGIGDQTTAWMGQRV
jgi:hypothetical protein